MKEIKYLGIKGTGEIDQRYNVERTASFSIFQCPYCFKEYEIKTSRGRKQKSCIDCRGGQKVTHGKSRDRIYSIWRGMVQRCHNPNSKSFYKYGGKGITVSEDWRTFEGFLLDMGKSYQEDLTLDRTDATKGYNKENCTWMSHSENSSKTNRKRKVVQLRKVLKPQKGFELVQEWDSAKMAADNLGLVAAHITVVCQNKRKSHGGFAWAYSDEYFKTN